MISSVSTFVTGQTARPIYRAIEDRFADLILRQELRPGDRLPSIADVARKEGVNRRTVMQAYQCLAGRGLVSVRTGSGTFVSDLESSGRVTGIGLVGWSDKDVYGYSGHHYNQAVYNGIREEATGRELNCHWIPLDLDVLNECRRREVSGCLVVSAYESSRLLLDTLQRERFKAVSISGGNGQPVPMVRGDDTQGMQLLMEHLFALGHRRIALIHGRPSHHAAYRRLRAYQDLMAGRDATIHTAWVCDDTRFIDQPGALERIMAAWFDTPRRAPTAIVAAADHISLLTLQALHRLGLRPGSAAGCPAAPPQIRTSATNASGS
ncbi:MAG: GntR family transcriptional regulator, partial [Phycisphaerae bacterium]|nr:GntR family transcriptional regulator [Phycisphaerae bacterium]